MRESSRIEKTHLPVDSFEEWIKSQVTKSGGEKHPRKVSENHYETWVRERVKSRMHKAQRAAISGTT